MSEENKNEKHRGLFMVMAVVITVPLFYVLSMGPTAIIGQKFPKTADTWLEFYYPVGWLHDHTVLRKPLDLYFNLWGFYEWQRE